MSEELVDFLSSHGTLLIVAVTFVAVVGLIQWRKIRIAEIENTFNETMFSQGAAGAEFMRLVAAHRPYKKGMLEQFGELSAGAKLGILFSTTILLLMFLSATIAISAGISHQQGVQQMIAQQQQRSMQHRSQRVKLAIAPERPFIRLQESANGTCRIFSTGGYPTKEMALSAVISEQDNPEGELIATVSRPPHQYTESGSEVVYEVSLESVRGTGQYSIQVTASNQYQEYAQASFNVVVVAGNAPIDFSTEVPDGS